MDDGVVHRSHQDEVRVLVVSDIADVQTRMEQGLPSVVTEDNEAPLFYSDCDAIEAAIQELKSNETAPYAGLVIDMDVVPEDELPAFQDSIHQMQAAGVPLMLYSDEGRTQGLNVKAEKNLFVFDAEKEPFQSGNTARLLQSFGKKIAEFNQKPTAEKAELNAELANGLEGKANKVIGRTKEVGVPKEKLREPSLDGVVSPPPEVGLGG